MTQLYFALFTDRTLPVELVSFTALAEDNKVILNWQTSAELNNYGFYIERKRSEINGWKEIGFVKGNGSVNTPKCYAYEDRELSAGRYYYQLKQTDYNGNNEHFLLSGDVTVGVPSKFKLSQNYPNPFNASTKIDIQLSADSKVTLKIYDITGREIMVLMNNEFKKADYYAVQFNGSSLSSGVYFYRILVQDSQGRNKFVQTKKMVLLK